MGKRLLRMAMIALPLVLMSMTAAGQESKAAPERARTELAKDDITTLMAMVGRLPAAEQDRRMERIWEDLAVGKTPRSDFLFCTGYAYLGNYKAQACLGYAYENGRGVQRDTAAAYVWYSIALDNPIRDIVEKQKIQADRDRMKKTLLTGTPAKTEKELDDLLKTQRELKIECQAEIRDTKF
ncbi:MAG TPA: hypothetical protein VMG30_00975 [Acidobacteriota bacterium]|nr:hypothetical protein [Acidobacteriota bacterium]